MLTSLLPPSFPSKFRPFVCLGRKSLASRTIHRGKQQTPSFSQDDSTLVSQYRRSQVAAGSESATWVIRLLLLIVSPQDYFRLTPLLPSVAVGTLEARSIIQPARHKAHRVSMKPKRSKSTLTTSKSPSPICRDINGDVNNTTTPYDILAQRCRR